jgi:hypothetical protein
MILIERLQRAGASETEIIRAVAEIDGRAHSERRREPYWRRFINAIFATPT